MNSDIKSAVKEAKKYLKHNPVFLDTETTGFHNSQIIELAILDADDNILFHSFFKPTCKIDIYAEKVHGISIGMLSNKPSWPEKIDEIKSILINKNIIIFNSSFDIRLFRDTCLAFGINADWVNLLKTSCAMKLAAKGVGTTNANKSISLSKAMLKLGVSWRGDAHSAIADTQATIDVVKSIAQHSN